MQLSSCKCGKIVPLKREMCPHCGKQMTIIECGNDAKLLTYTTLYTVPEGFDSPINLTLVELERGAKLLCVCIDEDDLKIGKKGKIIFKNDRYYFSGNK
jgi:uncharacterized OB-fold protein